MATERQQPPRARLFVALDLPDDVRGALTRWQDAELGDPALRRVDAQALHVTLCFLGYLPEPRIEAVASVLRRIEAAPVAIRLETSPLPLPRRGRARLYVLAAPSADAVALQGRVAAALAEAGLYTPEGSRGGGGAGGRRRSRRRRTRSRRRRCGPSKPSDSRSTVRTSVRTGPSTWPWRAST